MYKSHDDLKGPIACTSFGPRNQSFLALPLTQETVNMTKCRGLAHVAPGTFASLPFLDDLNLSGNQG